MNSPLELLKNDQSRFKHSGRMAFHTSLAQNLFMAGSLDKGQMHLRMIILCFVIKFRRSNIQYFSSNVLLLCTVFLGRLQWVSWSETSQPVMKSESSLTFSKYQNTWLRLETGFVTKLFCTFLSFLVLREFFFSVILLDLLTLHNAYHIK